MKRWLYLSRTITGTPDTWAVIVEGAERAMTRDGVSRKHADGSFTARLAEDGVGPLNPTLVMRFGVAAERRDGRSVLPITFKAETADVLFPEFHGAVEFEPLSHVHSRLVLVGTYAPPLGPIGASIDAAVLHRVAEATGEALLDRLASGAVRPAVNERPARPQRLMVADVMTREPVTLSSDLPLRTAALLLVHLDITGAPVVSDDGDLVGVLTERDLLEKEGPRPFGIGHAVDDAWRRREALTVGDACSRPARTTSPDVSLHEAVGEMLRHDIRRLVVVEAGHIVGIVTRRDIVTALLRTSEDVRHDVKHVLEEIAEPDVAATVEWGSVRLSGKVSRRSRVSNVAGVIRDIDGVFNVESDELKWAVDDVMPAMPYA